jgi:hypothetical protein
MEARPFVLVATKSRNRFVDGDHSKSQQQENEGNFYLFVTETR